MSGVVRIPVFFVCLVSFFFFFNDTATTEIYTLSLHDALPIYDGMYCPAQDWAGGSGVLDQDRKSTRLNSSHTIISYAVFCLKKKKKQHIRTLTHTLRHHMSVSIPSGRRP